MHKNKTIKTMIFLIFSIITILALISVSSATSYNETKKLDSGEKIIKVSNEKYKIKWIADDSKDKDKKFVDITYISMKNKKNWAYMSITLDKLSKNKMNISVYSTSMRFSTNKIIKTKDNTTNYFLKRIKPKIAKLAKDSILNKETLMFNETRYLNKTSTDSEKNKTEIKTYQMNLKVYYYTKTSSIEILKRYLDLNKSNENKSNETSLKLYKGINKDISIYKYSKGKLKITIYPYGDYVQVCGVFKVYTKYVKTKLSPRQYFLKVYKKELERKNFISI